MTSGTEQQAIRDAVQLMREADLHHGLRAWLIGEEIAAVQALRANSLEEYICGVNLFRAGCERQSGLESAAEAERRGPNGRRVYTAIESEEYQERAAKHLGNAEESELAAMLSLGLTDISDVRHAVAHMNEVDTARWPGAAQQEWFAAVEAVRLFRAWQRKRQRWQFVRGRAEQSSQSMSKVLPVSHFDRQDFGGARLARSTESGPAGTVASAVELLARWDLSGDTRGLKEPTKAALEAIRAVRRGEHSESGLAHVASMFRAGGDDFLDELDWKEEGDDTLQHIAEMRSRTFKCFERFGRPIQPGSWRVESERFRLTGHIDFVSADTIWDLKVSSTGPSKVDLLQLLLYLITFNDDPANSLDITHVGIYNPRMDTAWRLAVADIPNHVLSELESIAASRQSPED